MHSLLLHIANEEPIMIDVEKMPEPTDTCIVGMNPRKRDGKEVHYILAEVTTVIFPWHRVTFVEVMPGEEEEEILSFVRE
ncbi:MAG: hypothetical protein JXB47_20505 [Anaerolineae bacterium]|nr:hypothetical protein [Anaerolineae bacterium]